MSPIKREISATATAAMGCSESKLHPKNAELVKFKKNHDSSKIREAQPVHVWVIGRILLYTLWTCVGAAPEAARELGALVAAKHGYVALSERALLEAEAATNSERGQLVRAILQDNGQVSLSITEDLMTEALLTRVEGLKGVVFTDQPRCRCQAKMIKKLVGPVSLVIFMKWSEAALKAALRLENDEEEFTKRMEEFNKHVLPLARHKHSCTVDGETGPSACMSACTDLLNRISIAGC